MTLLSIDGRDDTLDVYAAVAAQAKKNPCEYSTYLKEVRSAQKKFYNTKKGKENANK